MRPKSLCCKSQAPANFSAGLRTQIYAQPAILIGSHFRGRDVHSGRCVGTGNAFRDKFPPRRPIIKSGHTQFIEIIADKYAEHLPKLYRTLLDQRPQMRSWPLAEMIAKSSLPAEKQRDLFLYAAHHKDLEHRRQGLYHLQKLDPQQFLKLLLETLDSFPKTPAEPYWHCREAAFALLVVAADDPRA